MNPEWLKYILPGDVIVMSLCLLAVVFFYKYPGKKILKEIEMKQTIEGCVGLRGQCQILRNEKACHIEDMTDLKFEQVIQQLDTIIKTQKDHSDRLDRFLKINNL
jgi:hypothetical protein